MLSGLILRASSFHSTETKLPLIETELRNYLQNSTNERALKPTTLFQLIQNSSTSVDEFYHLLVEKLTSTSLSPRQKQVGIELLTLFCGIACPSDEIYGYACDFLQEQQLHSALERLENIHLKTTTRLYSPDEIEIECVQRNFPQTIEVLMEDRLYWLAIELTSYHMFSDIIDTIGRVINCVEPRVYCFRVVRVNTMGESVESVVSISQYVLDFIHEFPIKYPNCVYYFTFKLQAIKISFLRLIHSDQELFIYFLNIRSLLLNKHFPLEDNEYYSLAALILISLEKNELLDADLELIIPAEFLSLPKRELTFEKIQHEFVNYFENISISESRTKVIQYVQSFKEFGETEFVVDEIDFFSSEKRVCVLRVHERYVQIQKEKYEFTELVKYGAGNSVLQFELSRNMLLKKFKFVTPHAEKINELLSIYIDFYSLDAQLIPNTTGR